MKIERRKTYCQNCERPLTLSDNYCPNCGQENLTTHIGVGTLIHDFFANYFSFDSRLGRSIWPFLSKPGYLTNRFIEGKRVSYINPLRFYIILSFIFFFILGYLASQVDTGKQEELVKVNDNNVDVVVDLPFGHRDTVTSIQANPVADSTYENAGEIALLTWLKDDSMTPEQILDSLDVKDNREFGAYVVKQGKRVMKKGADSFAPYVVSNISIALFIMLPVYALLLYLFFRKSIKLYINHLIHALHLHCFALLLYLLALLEAVIWRTSHALPYLLFIALLYVTLSAKRVYNQSIAKTFFKVFFIGMLYSGLIVLALGVEVIASFMLF